MTEGGGSRVQGGRERGDAIADEKNLIANLEHLSIVQSDDQGSNPRSSKLQASESNGGETAGNSQKSTPVKKNKKKGSPGAKAAKVVYVVVCGKKPGVYTSWLEAAKSVTGFSTSIYKGYTTEADAYSAYRRAVARGAVSSEPLTAGRTISRTSGTCTDIVICLPHNHVCRS